jgi:L-asparaginase
MQADSMTTKRTKLLLLSLGGTVAMTGDAQSGVKPTLTAADLLAAVPGIGPVADIEPRSFRQIPGAHLSFADIEALAMAIDDSPEHAGFIITQGTDTIEETAFILDLLVRTDRPVIVVGGMRHPGQAGADGPANLLAAVRVAASPQARGLGTLVVMNDEIHAARFVRKTHTTNPATFASPLAGPLGFVVEDRVRVLTRVDRRRPIGLSPHARAVKVAVVQLAFDDAGESIDAAVGAQFDGIVVQALGAGHASPAAADAIERAAKVMPVVLTSRAGSGETLAATYGFDGGEIDLQRRGALRVAWLDGAKARVLLTLLLRHDPVGLRDRIGNWS